MKELRCKCPISWKWDCRGDILFLFVKILMSFRSLELHDKLLESVSLSSFYVGRKLVDDVSFVFFH